MKLLVPNAAGLLKTAATPVNLKFAALAGLVGASTVVGAISASSSSEQIKGFLNASFKPVADFMVPIFKQIGTGAKGIGEGFNKIWESYKNERESIHTWIQTNLKLSQIKDGWNKVVETISDWFEKARVFIKDKLWEFIKEKILTIFKNWDENRQLIFKFGTFFKESLVPTLKALFTSEEGGKESRMSQFWNLITSEGGIQTVIDTAQLYIKNREPFGQMNSEEFSGIIDRLLDDHETFRDGVQKLLGDSNVDKQKIIDTLNPQGIAGIFGKAGKLMEKVLTTALSSPLGEDNAKAMAKAASQQTIEFWKWVLKEVVLPAVTTTCEDTSKSSCFSVNL